MHKRTHKRASKRASGRERVQHCSGQRQRQRWRARHRCALGQRPVGGRFSRCSGNRQRTIPRRWWRRRRRQQIAKAQANRHTHTYTHAYLVREPETALHYWITQWEQRAACAAERESRSESGWQPCCICWVSDNHAAFAERESERQIHVSEGA